MKQTLGEDRELNSIHAGSINGGDYRKLWGRTSKQQREVGPGRRV